MQQSLDGHEKWPMHGPAMQSKAVPALLRISQYCIGARLVDEIDTETMQDETPKDIVRKRSF